MKEPKVSVCIVTYNHINYIEQCLNSLVNQETDFEFEILVSDDCSSDDTQDVLYKYEKLYPDLVKVFCQQKNLGPVENFRFIHGKARGKYIAHIDGDDYALPGKIKKQSEYLDKYAECNIVWHRMYTVDTAGIFYEDNYVDIGLAFKRFDIIDLIANISIGSNSSKMYRRDFDRNQWIEYFDIDFSLNVLKLANPDTFAAFTSDEILGVYRSSIGISVTHNYEIKIKIYKWLLRFYADKLVDKSLINAKIFLLLLSDIKHFKKTMLYGFYAFLSTFMNFRFKSLKLIRSRTAMPLNRSRIVNIKV